MNLRFTCTTRGAPDSGSDIAFGSAETRDAGQATVVMVLVLALALGAATLLVRFAAVSVDRAQARTAADAAALAGAAEQSDRAAQHAALANGGRMVSFRFVDGQIEVTVQVRGAQATARAVATVKSLTREGVAAR